MTTYDRATNVLGKTSSLLVRQNGGKDVSENLSEEFLRLNREESHKIATVKTDGTCGMIYMDAQGKFHVLRRVDTKVSERKKGKERPGRNFQRIMDNGVIIEIGGKKCYQTTILRGSGKCEIEAQCFIFELDEQDKPRVEANHIVGFTPIVVTDRFRDDVHIATAIVGENGTADMKIRSTVFEGSLDIPVRTICPSEILSGESLRTVEIMGPKVSNHYGFTSDLHFVNPHGSIVYPEEETPSFDYQSLMKWMTNESNNRWANVEGIVIHFPDENTRFKFHVGYFGLANRWKAQTESGITFVMED